MVRVLYFAWVRERIGMAGENIDTDALTVGDMIRELAGRDERYRIVFSDPSSLRVAVDQRLGDLETPISEASEIAIFPPMTGG